MVFPAVAKNLKEDGEPLTPDLDPDADDLASLPACQFFTPGMWTADGTRTSSPAQERIKTASLRVACVLTHQ